MEPPSNGTISFVLKQSTDPQDRVALLKWLLTQEGCVQAGFLSEKLRETSWRIGYAKVESSKAERLKTSIANRECVQAADIESKRKLQ
jgi:hypothetical protein